MFGFKNPSSVATWYNRENYFIVFTIVPSHNWWRFLEAQTLVLIKLHWYYDKLKKIIMFLYKYLCGS